MRTIFGGFLGALSLVALQFGAAGLNLPIPLPITMGGTGQITQIAAFDALAPGTTAGDLIGHNGTDHVRFPTGVTGQFLRVNPSVATRLEWVAAPNFDWLTADVVNSSSTVPTLMIGIAFVPDPDTWTSLNCTLAYQTAATGTGVAFSVWAADIGGADTPQFIAYTVKIQGVTADTAGTTSGTEFLGQGTAHDDLVVSSGVAAATTYYTATIEGSILTHATSTDAFISLQVRSEVNLSAVTVREGSACGLVTLHVDS